MTPRHRKPRDVVQRNKGHGYSDEIGQWMIDAFRANKNPAAAAQGKPPHPSMPEAVQSTPPASPPSEVEQQAALTGPSGKGGAGQSRA